MHEYSIMKRHITLFVDGASRNNPGQSGAGIYLLRDSEIVHKEGFYLGIKTNNQAEYMALLLGLFFIGDYHQPGDTVRIVSDSQLLVMQIKNMYKVKNLALQQLHALAQKMLLLYDVRIEHVLRADNTFADAMANEGLDKKNPLPDRFVALLNSHNISI